MKMTTLAVLALAAAAALPARVGAQEPVTPPATSAAPASPGAAPTPAPTPMPILMGPAYDTLRALAAMLKTETEHVVAVASGGPAMGRRMFVVNSRMYMRRTANFATRLETYRSDPFDVAGEVTQMRARAGLMSGRQDAAPAMAAAREDWALITDVLDRMGKLLAGEKVVLPSPHPPRALPTPDPSAALPGFLDSRPAAGRTPPRVALPAPTPTPSPSPSPSPKG